MIGARRVDQQSPTIELTSRRNSKHSFCVSGELISTFRNTQVGLSSESRILGRALSRILRTLQSGHVCFSPIAASISFQSSPVRLIPNTGRKFVPVPHRLRHAPLFWTNAFISPCAGPYFESAIHTNADITDGHWISGLAGRQSTFATTRAKRHASTC